MSIFTLSHAKQRFLRERAIIAGERATTSDDDDDDDVDPLDQFEPFCYAYRRFMERQEVFDSGLCAEMDWFNTQGDTDHLVSVLVRAYDASLDDEDEDEDEDRDTRMARGDRHLTAAIGLLEDQVVVDLTEYCARATLAAGDDDAVHLRARIAVVGTPRVNRTRFVAAGVQNALEQGEAGVRPPIPRVVADVIGQMVSARIDVAQPVRPTSAQQALAVARQQEAYAHQMQAQALHQQYAAERQAELRQLLQLATTAGPAAVAARLKRMLSDAGQEDAKRQRH